MLSGRSIKVRKAEMAMMATELVTEMAKKVEMELETRRQTMELQSRIRTCEPQVYNGM